jgi:hypothetical protein
LSRPDHPSDARLGGNISNSARNTFGRNRGRGVGKTEHPVIFRKSRFAKSLVGREVLSLGLEDSLLSVEGGLVGREGFVSGFISRLRRHIRAANRSSDTRSD